MFDPLQYFDSVEKALGECESYADIIWPKIVINSDRFKQWNLIFWRCEVKFQCGYRFTALESHCRGDRGEHLRKIKYRLMKENGELVFQVDSHISPIPYESCPHLHIGPSEDLRIEDGDPRLGDNSLRNFDFPKMWVWVLNYVVNAGRVPWQQ